MKPINIAITLRSSSFLLCNCNCGNFDQHLPLSLPPTYPLQPLVATISWTERFSSLCFVLFPGGGGNKDSDWKQGKRSVKDTAGVTSTACEWITGTPKPLWNYTSVILMILCTQITREEITLFKGCKCKFSFGIFFNFRLEVVYYNKTGWNFKHEWLRNARIDVVPVWPSPTDKKRRNICYGLNMKYPHKLTSWMVSP